jgi:phosphatidate cytidylyltransferase
MSPLALRFATVGVLLPVALAAIFWLDTRMFAYVAGGLTLAAAYEWARLARLPRVDEAVFMLCIIFVGMFCQLWVPDALDARFNGLSKAPLVVAAVFWLLVAPLWVIRRWPTQSATRMMLAGICVLPGFWAALVVLHARSSWLLFLAMGVVWIADTAAYFCGRAFGRHKLAPLVSPGKTWEGVAGAIVAVVVYVAVLALVVPGFARGAGAATLAAWLAGAAVLTMISVMGDLYESWLKRQAGVKDSGRLLPGHGGVLDRIDALLAALPPVALIMHWIQF